MLTRQIPIRRIPLRWRFLFAFTRRYVIDGPVPSHQETHRAPAHPIDRLTRSFRYTAAAIDRVVHHSVIAEFGSEMTSYRADRAGNRNRPKAETNTLPLSWLPVVSWS
jgi:hypothetical protein